MSESETNVDRGRDKDRDEDQTFPEPYQRAPSSNSSVRKRNLESSSTSKSESKEHPTPAPPAPPTDYSSVSYAPTHSHEYESWLTRQTLRFYSRLDLDRWLLLTMIGLATGLVMVLLKQCIQGLSSVQWRITQQYLQSGNIGAGFGISAGINSAFAFGSAILVTLVHPPAAGGGTPEVIAFLNGIVVHGALTLKNLVFKLLATILAVGSDLPVGTQAPVITFGAIIGIGVGQFQSRTFKWVPNLFKRFRNAEDRRAFTTAGVAAGVAAGFTAPIGGLLFAMEDLSSFWSKDLTWQTFYTAIVATSIAQLLNAAFVGFIYQGQFGIFMIDVVRPIRMHLVTLLPALLLGLAGGLLAACFTQLNILVNKNRKKFLAKVKILNLQRALKIAEPVLLSILMTCYSIFLPLAFPCKQESMVMDFVYSCSCSYNGMNITAYKPLTFDQYNCHPEGNQTMYNDGSTLIQGSGTAYLDKLWSRGTYYMYGYGTCLACFVIYFFMAIWTNSGSAVSGGIFLPILISGSLYGRAVGVGFVYVWQAISGSPYPSQDWNWIDPGVISAISAASLLAGINRMPVASTIIVIEMVGDINLIIPIVTSVVVSRMVANLLCQPLYKYMIESKSLPYLVQVPQISVAGQMINLELQRVKDVMSRPIMTIKSREKISHLANMLLQSKNSGFPVVEVDPVSKVEVVKGLITRLELYVILSSDDVLFASKSTSPIVTPSIPYAELSVDYTTATDSTLAEERIRRLSQLGEFSQIFINLEPFLNMSTPKVDEDYSLHRTYVMFRTMGLRHLVVTDSTNKVVGMITRKNLLKAAIAEKLAARSASGKDDIDGDRDKSFDISHGGDGNMNCYTNFDMKIDDGNTNCNNNNQDIGSCVRPRGDECFRPQSGEASAEHLHSIYDL